MHRLVTGTPGRLSLSVLAALCDIFDCTPGHLIATRAGNADVRQAGAGGPAGVTGMAAIRPRRARLRPGQ